MEETKFNATVEVDLDETTQNPQDSQVVSEEYLEKLEAEYDEYAAECEMGLQKALVTIDSLRKAYDRTGKRNPFDRVEHRIKTFKSVRGKCRDRGYDLNLETIQSDIKDVAGIRIVTKYLDEIDVIKDAIKDSSDIIVVSEKDYVAHPKENGYKSVHLNCQIGVYYPFGGGLRMRPLEIQIRTKIMNLWASLDHDINYKNPAHLPEVEEKFQTIARSFDKLEYEVMALRDSCEAANKSLQ